MATRFQPRSLVLGLLLLGGGAFPPSPALAAEVLSGAQLAEVEADIAEQRRIYLLAVEYETLLSQRVDALNEAYGTSRNLEIQRAIVELEKERDLAAEQVTYHAEMLADMRHRAGLAREGVLEAAEEALPEVEPRWEYLEKHRLPVRGEKLDAIVARFDSMIEEENKRFERFIRFADEEMKKDYLEALAKVREETFAHIYSLYTQWTLAPSSGFGIVLSRRPPPPPGYEEWVKSGGPKKAAGASPEASAGGSGGKVPDFNPGGGGRNSKANTKEAAEELRRMAEKEEDPVLKQIYIDEAERLEKGG